MRTINKSFFLMSFALLLLAQGCAVGNKYNFADTRADLQVSAAAPSAVAVATLDQRQDILSGTCPPTYVGMQRAGFGNPWRVNTVSDLPLAEDMTKAVSESLAKKGFKPTPVIVAHTLSEQQAKQALAAKQAARSFLILIKKWESDTYMNIGLDYDLRLMILGANQTVLAETSAAENKTIAGSFWDPPSAAKEQIPIAFKQVLEKLLNDPKIIAVLK
jgi:hypothetical protein